GALATATELLVELGAIADRRPTELGRALVELPLHPRLARMIVSSPIESRPMAAAMAALISERDVVERDRGGPLLGADIAERLAMLDRGPGGRDGRQHAIALVRPRVSRPPRATPRRHALPAPSRQRRRARGSRPPGRKCVARRR